MHYKETIPKKVNQKVGLPKHKQVLSLIAFFLYHAPRRFKNKFSPQSTSKLPTLSALLQGRGKFRLQKRVLPPEWKKEWISIYSFKFTQLSQLPPYRTYRSAGWSRTFSTSPHHPRPLHFCVKTPAAETTTWTLFSYNHKHLRTEIW